MLQRKHLVRFSVTLIMINVVMVGLVVINRMRYQSQVDQLSSQPTSEVQGARNVPDFSKDYILANSTFSSTRAFPSQQSVQTYLEKVNSPLAQYQTQGHSASYWIFQAARGKSSQKWGVRPQINPGVMLAFLEKEQSLLSESEYDPYSDPANRVRKAMGYGCPDDGDCKEKYEGLVNQLNWGAYQLQFNYNRAGEKSQLVAPYHVQNTITTLDEYQVFLQNAATAAVYRYTPHVYWGNYNLWKVITANGWGSSAQTYSKKEIDKANLDDKNQTIEDVDTGEEIPLKEVKPLLAKDYSYGTQNEDIKKIQKFLRQKEYYMTRKPSGMYGVVTEKAISNFIREEEILLTQPSQECRSLYEKKWSLGQEGEEVRGLQNCLDEVGYFEWPTITGYFGNVTRTGLEAVRAAIADKGSSEPVQSEPEETEDSVDTACKTLTQQTWKQGQSGEEVKKLQECLEGYGTFKYKHGATGYFGEVTRKALDDYRRQNQTENNPSSDKKEKDSCQQLVDQNWSIGQQSEEVRELQKCLQEAGTFNWKYGATGYFGEVTRKALEDYRKQLQGNETETAATNCQFLKDKKWQLGQEGSKVRKLQQCLRDEGYFRWPSNTGYFGVVTQTALQKSKGQIKSGSCQDLKARQWEVGERNEQVRKLQQCMEQAGTFEWKHGATGYFGEVTKEALIEWRGFF